MATKRRPIRVTLEWWEVALCGEVGLRRRVESLRREISNAPGFNLTDLFEVDIQGACGEYAAAKALQQPWDGSVNTYGRGDVGKLQIRTSRQATPFLIVQPKNNDRSVYVLVTGVAPTFTVQGWAYGRDVKQDKYLKRFGTRPMVYAMPPFDLRPIQTLPGMNKVR